MPNVRFDLNFAKSKFFKTCQIKICQILEWENLINCDFLLIFKSNENQLSNPFQFFVSQISEHPQLVLVILTFHYHHFSLIYISCHCYGVLYTLSCRHILVALLVESRAGASIRHPSSAMHLDTWTPGPHDTHHLLVSCPQCWAYMTLNLHAWVRTY